MSSIISMALRHAAFFALKNATSAGDAVHDSDFDFFHRIRAGHEDAVIFVSSMQENGTNYGPKSRSITLLIEFAVFTLINHTQKDADGQDHTTPSVVRLTSSRMREVALTLLQRQIERALSTSQNEWSELFLTLGQVDTFSISPGYISEGDSTRMAARRLELKINPIFEPAHGQAIHENEALGTYLKLIARDWDSRVADMLRETIIGTEVPDWDALRVQCGYSYAEASALGLSDPHDARAAPAALGEVRYDPV